MHVNALNGYFFIWDLYILWRSNNLKELKRKTLCYVTWKHTLVLTHCPKLRLHLYPAVPLWRRRIPMKPWQLNQYQHGRKVKEVCRVEERKQRYRQGKGGGKGGIRRGERTKEYIEWKAKREQNERKGRNLEEKTLHSYLGGAWSLPGTNWEQDVMPSEITKTSAIF